MTRQQLEQEVAELKRRVEELEARLADPGDPLEANHQRFVERIREQEARGGL